MLYGNVFILFLLRQMKFKVVKGFVSQLLYEIENDLFAIRSIILDRIPEFQGSHRTATIASAFFWMRGINDVDYNYFKEMEILVNGRIEHGNGKGRLPAGPSRRTRYRVLNCSYKGGSAKAA